MSSTAADVAVGGGAVAVSLLLLLCRRRRRPQPPSVGRYPLIGSHRHLPEPWHRSLHEKFGQEPVVVVHMGLAKVYIFNKWQPFKEAMLDNSEQLTGRLSQTFTASLFGDSGGIVSSDGEIWREYRRFTLRCLRDFGLGRRGAEELTLTEAEHLCRCIDEANGEGLETTRLFGVASSNIVCQLVFGCRLASEDSKFDQILQMLSAMTQNEDTNVTNSIFMSMMPMIDRFPIIAKLLTANEQTREALKPNYDLMSYCERHRDRHAASIDSEHEPQDFIDAHLLHQRSSASNVFNDTRLALAVADLFGGGTDTTTHSLRWAILFAIDNPTVVEAVHREIVEAVGRERLPGMSDRRRLPLTLAFIEETLRLSSLAPLGLFHRVTDTVVVGGYELEKDSICTYNVYAIHRDEADFPEPNRFKPERHVRSGEFVKCERLAAFGLGKRACVGESLARMELFIFFAALVQKFKFELDTTEGRTVWDLTEDPNLFKGTFLRVPPKHKVVFKRR